MSSIASVSSSMYTGYSSGGVSASMSSSASVSGSTGLSGGANILTAGADALSVMQNNAMFSSFSQAMQSGDPMRMLVALLIMNALLGTNDDDQQKKTQDAMAGLAGLAMLGQQSGGSLSISFSQSTNITTGGAAGATSASTAYGAYTNVSSMGASSTFSLIA